MRFILALILTTTAAHAEMKCAPSIAAVTDALKSSFGETMQSIGAMDNGTAFVLFANPVTGTWTAVIIMPDGQACSPANGNHYTPIKPGDPA